MKKKCSRCPEIYSTKASHRKTTSRNCELQLLLSGHLGFRHGSTKRFDPLGETHLTFVNSKVDLARQTWRLHAFTDEPENMKHGSHMTSHDITCSHILAHQKWRKSEMSVYMHVSACVCLFTYV